MISVTITAESFDGFISQIENLLRSQNGAPVRARTSDLLIRNLSDNETANEDGSKKIEPEVIEKKSGRGRPRKEKVSEGADSSMEKKEPVTPDTQVPPNSEVANAKTEVAAEIKPEVTITTDDIYKALKSVRDTKGIDVAKKCIEDIGASRISDVKPEDFGKFLEICKKAAA